MKISSLILKPNLCLIQNEFVSLKERLSFENSKQVKLLRQSVEDQMNALETLLHSVNSLDHGFQGRVPANLFMAYKKAKLSLRIAKRTWSRLLSNESRIKKIQERRAHVTTIAA